MQPDEGLFTRQMPGDRFREQAGPVFQLEKINVNFDGLQALTDLSPNTGVGELCCIISPSGAGKMVLMDVITGKTRPQSGCTIYDQSIDLTTLDPIVITHQGIGRKFQEPTVFETSTVEGGLELAPESDKSVWGSLRERLSGEQRDHIDEILALLRLGNERTRRAELLSYGQEQFLEIGILLVQEPHLLLLDEPAAGMTDTEAEYTTELFRQLAGKYSLMVVEHDMGFVETIADRVTILHQGRVLTQGSLRDVQANEQVIEVYLGRQGVHMLQVKELNQYHGGSHILRGASFGARIGEVTCLLGRNGVEKTTLPKRLVGIIPARSGSVLWQDKNVTHWKPHQQVRVGVAYAPQGRGIFPRLTIEENLLLGLSRFLTPEARHVPDDIYALFPILQEMKHRRGGDLSGGQQQQLAIGRTLASRPQLLILNELTGGIQPSVIKEINQVISQLAHRGDITILLVEQFYDFAQQLADKYLLMLRGNIIQRGDGKNMEAESVWGLVAI